MISNLEKYKKDLDKLIKDGDNLFYAILYECHPKEFKDNEIRMFGSREEGEQVIKTLPSFKYKYQNWYSESLSIIRLLLPERIGDFVKLYEKPKARKKVDYENYVIADYLQSLSITRGLEKEKIVGPEAAIPQFQQQLKILESVGKRFESSLFDIKQLVQADLFDSELDVAKELNNKGFVRGAGAIAGVVLEKHLEQVCDNHNVKITKKEPTINDYNSLLKDNNVLETKDWRFIQHLGDLRNLCDHNKKKEPTREEIEDLITGVEKVSKTIY